MSRDRQIRQKRWYGALTALVLGCASAVLPFAQSASAATSSTPWPASPDWQSYGQAPPNAAVCPAAVVSTSGSVTGAANLVCGGSGGATLSETSGGATPTIVLDYGQGNVGGVPYFKVSAASGSPQLKAGLQPRVTQLPECRRWTGPRPGPRATPSRADTYTVNGPGHDHQPLLRAGRRAVRGDHPHLPRHGER